MKNLDKQLIEALKESLKASLNMIKRRDELIEQLERERDDYEKYLREAEAKIENLEAKIV
jgi:chromosome segregation ATPase